MTTQPNWSPTDDATADLLSLVADTNHPSADYEWTVFREALSRTAMLGGGLVRPNSLRPLLRDRVAPRRIGAFTNRAAKSGLIVATGEWEISDDTQGRNSGRPMRVYRWLGDR